MCALLLAEGSLRALGLSWDEFPIRRHFDFGGLFHVAFEPDDELLWVPKGYHATLGAGDTPPVIVFMGDSCTHIGTYHQRLVEMLEARGIGDPLPYRNLGVGAYSSFQGLQQLERDVLPIAPRVVTFYFGWNDHWVGLGDRKLGRVLEWRRSPLHRLRTVQLISSGYVAALQRWTGGHARRVPPNEFAANLEEMVALARGHRIAPVLLTAPTSHVRGRTPPVFRKKLLAPGDDLATVHATYADVVRDVARRTGAVLCDLEQEFRALPRRTLVGGYFRRDGVHLTSLGDREIARRLHACLEKNGVLARLVE